MNSGVEWAERYAIRNKETRNENAFFRNEERDGKINAVLEQMEEAEAQEKERALEAEKEAAKAKKAAKGGKSKTPKKALELE